MLAAQTLAAGLLVIVILCFPSTGVGFHVSLPSTLSRFRLLARTDDSGVFGLPEGDGDGDGDVKGDNKVGWSLPPPEYTIGDREGVLQILLLAFDSLQDFEIREMADLIFCGSSADHVRCQSNLVRLAGVVKALQETANREDELPFGAMEYLQDQYRAVMSEARMYGKDADFFRRDGGVVPPSERGGFLGSFWPR